MTTVDGIESAADPEIDANSTSAVLQLEENQSFEAEDVAEPIPPSDIVAYNELRSCADLFRLYETGKLEIQPDFQREVVWRKDEQSRFVDSLVKQLPIPSMCFSLDYKTQKWKVIDGLQRMSTIIRFFSAEPWKISPLLDIHAELRGAKNTDLKVGSELQKLLYSMVENVSIPVTVIRCDYAQESHMRYLFTIFHRLNSGGVRLNNQEIRNCIYTSPFNDFLKDFDVSCDPWQGVKQRIWGSMARFRSVEVLLRVLALGDGLANYDGNLARFLNDYMHAKSREPAEAFADLSNILEGVAAAAAVALEASPYGKLSLTQVEAVMVALYVNRGAVMHKNPEDLHAAFLAMLETEEFSAGARYAVSNVENVHGRLHRAIECFA